MNYTLLLIFIIILMAMVGGAQSEFKSSIAQYKYDSNQSISGVGFAYSYQSLATKYSTLKKRSSRKWRLYLRRIPSGPAKRLRPGIFQSLESNLKLSDSSGG